MGILDLGVELAGELDEGPTRTSPYDFERKMRHDQADISVLKWRGVWPNALRVGRV